MKSYLLLEAVFTRPFKRLDSQDDGENNESSFMTSSTELNQSEKFYLQCGTKTITPTTNIDNWFQKNN